MLVFCLIPIVWNLIFSIWDFFCEAKAMDIKNFISAINQIAEEKGIAYDKVIETIEVAIAAAYKKDYGKKGQIIKAKLDPETGQAKFWQVKIVVDNSILLSEEEIQEQKEQREQGQKQGKIRKAEKIEIKQETEGEAEKSKIRFNPERHIMLESAKEIDPKLEIEQELELPLETKEDYGRIAAQTAKQVILQKIREVEKQVILEEYKSKQGEIVSGVIQRVEGRNVYLDLGKWQGCLPQEEQVRGEFYNTGQRIKAYLLKIEDTLKGPAIILSRAYPKFVSKLFELEVPEIATGVVVIKSIAREAGSRSKIAVFSTQEGIDPIGSAVGQKGTRVMAVINELGGEKIDIIEYFDEPEKYIINALAPAKISEVKIDSKNKAVAIVPEDQLSLAIGKDGQNVRLAAKLTGWKIDIISEEKAKEQEAEEKKEQKEKKKKDKDDEVKKKKEKKKKDEKKTKKVKKVIKHKA